MMDNVTIRENMVTRAKSFLKIVKILFLSIILSDQKLLSSPPHIVVNKIIYVFCEKIGCFENK
jgi:hypothetical protein